MLINVKEWLNKYWHYIIITVASAVIIMPMIILQGDYMYTVHDFLDQVPGHMEVLRYSNLFYSIDSPLPILQGISSCYLYYDYGIYRLLNFMFGFVRAEIVLKIMILLLGYYFMKHLLRYVFTDSYEENNKIFSLLAFTYAIMPYTSARSLGFAVLPFFIEKMIDYFKNPAEKFRKKDLFFFLFSFFMPFSSLGIFVLMFWGCAYVINLAVNRNVNKRMLLCIFIMAISVCVFNINILLYTLRGDEINRTLLTVKEFTGWKNFFITTIDVFMNGQYHAPVKLDLLVPVCITGCVALFFCFAIKKTNRCVFVRTFSLISLMLIFSVIYTAADAGWMHLLMEKIFPFMKGFGFQRIVTLNNVLWFLLISALVTVFVKGKAGRFLCSLLIIAQIVIIICSSGLYQNTWDNITRSNKNAVSFNEYFDENYFDELKKRIDYDYEPVISVGYHPTVAMYNGFNNLDGYFTTHPMWYHERFREIIEPQLEVYPVLKNYYDTWGGRMYVYIDDKRNVAPSGNKTVQNKELFINVEAFKNMGGTYILSRYVIQNAEQLGIEMVLDFNDEDSIYHVFVYKAI